MSKRYAPAVVLDARVVTGSGGGPDKTILNSPRFLLPAGYRNLCVYMHPPRDAGFEQLRKKAAEREAPFVAVPDRGAWDLSVIPAFLNLCRRENVQIWHGHDYKTNALGLLLRRFWPMRMVTTVHGWVAHTNRTPLYYRIDKYCLPRYEAVIGVRRTSPSSLDCGVQPDRCLLIENGVDIDRISALPGVASCAKLRVREPIAHWRGGRLSARKADISSPREHAHRPRPDVSYGSSAKATSVGFAKQIDELGQEAFAFGLQIGHPRLYQAMDVFCLSSLREGLPNVVLEAWPETPAVATCMPGAAFVQHEQNGPRGTGRRSWLDCNPDQLLSVGFFDRLAGRDAKPSKPAIVSGTHGQSACPLRCLLGRVRPRSRDSHPQRRPGIL